MSPCVLVLGFIKCIWSTSHWSKRDNRFFIWSIPAIRERGDIRVIWWGITPPALILPPITSRSVLVVAPFWGLGEFTKLSKKLFSSILSWFDPASIEFGCHGYQINTDKWPIKVDNHTWACNIYLLLHFLFQIRILFIYSWLDVNKPYLEKHGDERVKLGQQW